MKEVLFILPTASTGGGIQRSLSILTSALSEKKEYSITVMSLFKSGENKFDYGSSTMHIQSTMKRGKKGSTVKRRFFKVKQECAKLLSKKNFEIIVVESLGLVPLIPKKILKDKTVKIIVRDHVGYRNYKTFGITWYGLKKTIKFADYLIVLTKENKKEYSKIYPKLKDRIKVISNTLEPNIKKGIYNPESKKICFVGRLSNEKGAHLLINAFTNVIKQKKYTEWQLDIYGTGKELDNLKEQVINQGIERYVNFKGHNKNIINLYQDYSFLVVPSKFESFGIVILEALTIGIPVISFDCNYGPRTMIKHGKNGILVPTGDINELSKSIDYLISNKKYREKLASNTTNSINEYNHFKVIKKWLKIL